MTLHDFLKNHSNLLTTKTNAILYPYRPLKDNLNIKSPSSRTEIKGLGDQTFGGELVQGAVCRHMRAVICSMTPKGGYVAAGPIVDKHWIVLAGRFVVLA